MLRPVKAGKAVYRSLSWKNGFHSHQPYILLNESMHVYEVPKRECA